MGPENRGHRQSPRATARVTAQRGLDENLSGLAVDKFDDTHLVDVAGQVASFVEAPGGRPHEP
jgi:hypothetical protein